VGNRSCRDAVLRADIQEETEASGAKVAIFIFSDSESRQLIFTRQTGRQ
jgi:hypothetical protein